MDPVIEYGQACTSTARRIDLPSENFAEFSFAELPAVALKLHVC